MGCRNGIFVKNARSKRFDTTGIKPSSSAVGLCKKQIDLFPYHGYLSFESDLPKNYGSLSAWDVNEHVSNPKMFLEICYSHLEKDGILLLETPDESALIRKIINIIEMVAQKFNSSATSNIYYPSHRFYFTHKSIRNLLTNSGFSDVRIYKEHSIYSKSIAKYKLYRNYSDTLLKIYSGLFTLLRAPIFWNKQVVLCRKA